MTHTFQSALQIKPGDIVSIVGAGGKTSLMFKLAEEARSAGLKTLVTTSTRLFMPQKEKYYALDLSGNCFSQKIISAAGIYVAGIPDSEAGKMRGISESQLEANRERFDLILIEADGSACKPLKGWKENEPVIYPQTSVTIGVIDIQTVGRTISADLVHRLELFLHMAGTQAGEPVSTDHLEAVISHPDGLFGKTIGRRQLYVNKVERASDIACARQLCARFEALTPVAGSLRQGCLHEL